MRSGDKRASWSGVFVVGLSLSLAGAAGPGDGGGEARRTEQVALRHFAPLVGDWKGTGQVRRGSNQGAWTETAGWSWKLGADSARLELQVNKGKFLRAATLIPPDPARASGRVALDAVLLDGSHRVFRAQADAPSAPDGPVVFEADGAGEGVRRITLAIPNDARFLLTYESVPRPGAPAVRLGEVGSTRVGAAFAAGESGPKCIVTGGKGTMTVAYQGKSYPVCCSGCRDLFNQDPAAVLAEAAARKPGTP